MLYKHVDGHIYTKVGEIWRNGDCHAILSSGHLYAVDLGFACENLSEGFEFYSHADANWFFGHLLGDGDSKELREAREKVDFARGVYLQIEMFAEHDGNDLVMDCEFEGLGFYRAGTPMADVIRDFEDKTGVTEDYMLGYEDEPFFSVDEDGQYTIGLSA